LAKLEKDLTPVVVYVSLSEDDNPVWVRPLKEFQETVEIDGEVINRFSLCKETISDVKVICY
jgi:hypothetical protein